MYSEFWKPFPQSPTALVYQPCCFVLCLQTELSLSILQHKLREDPCTFDRNSRLRVSLPSKLGESLFGTKKLFLDERLCSSINDVAAVGKSDDTLYLGPFKWDVLKVFSNLHPVQLTANGIFCINSTLTHVYSILWKNGPHPPGQTSFEHCPLVR